jgi:hypothetical protein
MCFQQLANPQGWLERPRLQAFSVAVLGLFSVAHFLMVPAPVSQQ